jgi:2-(1,2-epoxy-1,2-dihydrophenyl)acetyl-CoA isomerase
MELALLSSTLDAETAKSLGLVNWVVPADQLAQETQRIARELAKGPTVAFGEAKRLMNQSFERGVETQMEEELAAFARCAKTQDLAEGVAAFVEKRKAQFKGS